MTREELLAAFAEPIPVLDKGSIELLDVMGNDAAVLQAARTSTRRENVTVDPEKDRGLIRYLLRHKHATPFESCRVKVRVKLPIFVERQWARHRTAGWSEVSARYTELPGDYYLPDVTTRPMGQSTSNRQGSEAGLEPWVANQFVQRLRHICDSAYEEYQRAVEAGVALEIARTLLPVNWYTVKVWWMDLRNLLGLLELRLDAHAQWEIRQYAEALSPICAAWVPWTWEAFEDYALGAHTFSRQEMVVLRRVAAAWVSDEALAIEAIGGTFAERVLWRDEFIEHAPDLTQRERKAFLAALGRLEGLDG